MRRGDRPSFWLASPPMVAPGGVPQMSISFDPLGKAAVEAPPAVSPLQTRAPANAPPPAAQNALAHAARAPLPPWAVTAADAADAADAVAYPVLPEEASAAGPCDDDEEDQGDADAVDAFGFGALQSPAREHLKHARASFSYPSDGAAGGSTVSTGSMGAAEGGASSSDFGSGGVEKADDGSDSERGTGGGIRAGGIGAGSDEGGSIQTDSGTGGGGVGDADFAVPALLVSGDDLACAMIEQEMEHVRQLGTLVHALESVLFDGNGLDLQFTPVADEDPALAAAAAAAAAATPDATALFSIDVAIGGGQQARIVVHHGANTTELAQRFVTQHQLPQSSVARLAQVLQLHSEAQVKKRLSPAPARVSVSRESDMHTVFSL